MKRIVTSLQDCEAILLDVGGTLTREGHAVPGAVEFAATLRRKRIPQYVLSNTTTSSAIDLTAKLNAMGFSFSEDQLITANRAAMRLMKAQGMQSVYIIGTHSQRQEFLEGGFNVLDNTASVADAVVASLDLSLNYEILAKATTLLRSGAAFFATNKDRLWLDDTGQFMPDTGPTIAFLEQAAEKKAIVTGKPTQVMMEFATAVTGVSPKQMAIIGDQFESDMQMAQEFGMVSVLVLSGQTTHDDVAQSAYKPDYVVESVSHLTPLFK